MPTIKLVGDQVGNGVIVDAHLAAAAVGAGKLSAAAKQEALQSKLVIALVQSADQTNPSASTVVVSSNAEFGPFSTTAGVDPAGSAKGVACLLEAAGGTEFNTTTGKVGSAAKADQAMCDVADTSSNEIVDATGKPVWAVISTTARTTGGAYTLRFFSGEFGSGSEAVYTMAQAFVLKYPRVFDLDDMSRGAFARASAFVSAQAAQLAAGQIGSTELATGAVTNAKIAADAVTADKIQDGAVGTPELATGAVTTAKIGALAVTSAELATGAVVAGKIATGGISAAGQFAAGVVDAAAILDGSITTTEIHPAASIAESQLADLGKESSATLIANIRTRDANLNELPATGFVFGTGDELKIEAQSPAALGIRILQANNGKTGMLQTGQKVTVGTGAADLTLALATADATNPRIDVVYADSAGALQKVTGTPAASPSEPGLPASALKLGVVRVAANATTIANSVIWDHRRRSGGNGTQEDFSGDGAATAFTLTKRQRGGVKSVRVYRNGFRILYRASPTTIDEYVVTDDAEKNGTSISFGAAPASGSTVAVDYRY